MLLESLKYISLHNKNIMNPLLFLKFTFIFWKKYYFTCIEYWRLLIFEGTNFTKWLVEISYSPITTKKCTPRTISTESSVFWYVTGWSIVSNFCLCCNCHMTLTWVLFNIIKVLVYMFQIIPHKRSYGSKFKFSLISLKTDWI